MSKAKHIMVLYTGGTIGMQASANGLAPASGFEARMREQLAHLPAPTWRFREMAPLIDSANMTPAYWQRLRSAVVEAVDDGCDAVLILHIPEPSRPGDGELFVAKARAGRRGGIPLQMLTSWASVISSTREYSDEQQAPISDYRPKAIGA